MTKVRRRLFVCLSFLPISLSFFAASKNIKDYRARHVSQPAAGGGGGGAGRGIDWKTKNDRPASDTASVGPRLLWTDGASKSYDGVRYQFRDISFTISSGARIALIGVNGVGKSTLMRCLAGIESLDAGTIGVEGRPSIVYVEQEPVRLVGDENETTSRRVRDVLAAPGSATQGGGEDVEALEKALHALRSFWDASDAAGDGSIFSDATILMDEHGGWELETKLNMIATKLNIQDMMERKLSSLSGGEKKRVALAAGLLREPDFLLLDEPTNHLDWRAIEWLASYLGSGKGGSSGGSKKMTLLLVTHDRYFLERVCSGMLELDGATVFRYEGTYDGFLEAKVARMVADDAALRASRNKLSREAEWMRRQPKARSTKQKARIDAYQELRGTTKKRLQDRSSANAMSGEIVDFEAAGATGRGRRRGGSSKARRLGENVINFLNARLEIMDSNNGKKCLLENFSYEFARGERIGIVGANGAGKSTFLRAMVGAMPLTGGERVVGETVVFGYYDQLGLEALSSDVKVLDFVVEQVELGNDERKKQMKENGELTYGNSFGNSAVDGGGGGSAINGLTVPSVATARTLLKQFAFPASRWNDNVARLSGGERRRLQLLSVLAKQPNVLILDEPTNDLDLQTLGVLEDYLQLYDGVLVTVSHDRYFMDRVLTKTSDEATDDAPVPGGSLFVFEGDGKVRQFFGSYTEYLAFEEERASATTASNDAATAPSNVQNTRSFTSSSDPPTKEKKTDTSGKKKLSYLEQREYDMLENEIELLSERATKLQAELDSSALGYTELASLYDEITTANAEVEEKTERWMELAEKKEAMEAS